MKQQSQAVRRVPILFSREMVSAILQGKKTVTRRVIDLDYAYDADFSYMENYPDGTLRAIFDGRDERFSRIVRHGKPGDLLYVREAWGRDESCKVIFRQAHEGEPLKWKPSIHLPAQDSRIILRNVQTTAQRLSEMTDNDAISEGVLSLPPEWVHGHWPDYWLEQMDYLDKKKAGQPCRPPIAPSPLLKFKALWNDINGQWQPVKLGGVITGYECFPFDVECIPDINGERSWGQYEFEFGGLTYTAYPDPYVWAVEFEVVSVTGWGGVK